MQEKAKAGELRAVNGSDAQQKQASKRRRWDQAGGDDVPAKKKSSSWDAAEAATPSNSRWDETPGRPKGELHHPSQENDTFSRIMRHRENRKKWH